MKKARYNTLVVLGPTASGKTTLGVALAHALGGEILSADSRQVYRGLDIASGKDLDEYAVYDKPVPYHLIDIVDLDEEYNLFAYQQAFFKCFEEVRPRCLPVVVGGTGLYLEAALLKGYRMVSAPVNEALREELTALDDVSLAMRLLTLQPGQHNSTDLKSRDRTIRAIEIVEYSRDHTPPPPPDIRPFLLGTRWKLDVLQERIRARLQERLERGLVEEVEQLHENGVSWERLEELGLECRFIARFLQGKIHNQNDLYQKLGSAIVQFARRQHSWFRRMEKRGAPITWIEEARLDLAKAAVAKCTFE